MQSELHKRLNHLIQYSSGLILIKSEPDFSVSTCVDALLSEQNENDEVAVLTVKPSMMLDDFRQQLTQQLSSKLAPRSGNLPLAQLLAPSIGQIESGQSQGLLICISKGEQLSPSMLEDLQQLILTLHAGSERQINVLVFAQPQWVNQTYQILGKDNKNNVIVVDAGASTEHPSDVSGSELEQLIANKRQAFAQRIEQRNHVPLTQAPSVMQRPWFIPVIGLLFFALFAGILLSQYPELLDGEVDSELTTETDPIHPRSSSAADPSKDTDKNTDTRPQDDQVSTTGVSKGNSERDNNTADDISSTSMAPLASVDADTPAPAATQGDALVSNWMSESKRIDDAQTRKNADIQSLHDAAPENNNVQTGSLRKPVAADVPTEVPLPVAVNGNKPPKEIAKAEKLPTYLFDEAEILALPDAGYVLQIIGFSMRDAIDNYLRANNIQQDVWVYQTKRYNKDWYVLLYHKHYPSLAAALQGVASLPKGMHDATPFPKALQKVHQEIDSAN
ncbi:SPOR domain-containing protein [Paraglaciecola polaris]|uniref:DamX protein n=1 Tax=Paraglaciecola polaris LMG 21857 TaxID=1129793 RepID=K7AFD0_9ALTE|nr:DamX protein [Paraglaciecola polaris LMG 21857]